MRGLDYYTRTTFEIVHGSLGAQNSVLGGGRYDGLAEALGSKVPGPGIGFSIGEDRLVMSVEEKHRPDGPGRLVHRADGRSRASPRRRCWRARSGAKGAVVEIAPDGKLKRSLELANKIGARAHADRRRQRDRRRAHTRSRT